MQSTWRIACVRIPRFPIAAALRERQEQSTDQQLSLALGIRSQAGTRRGERDSRSLVSGNGKNGHTIALPRHDFAMPLWDERHIALVDAGKLRAISRAAARSRVSIGMTPVAARALCADLEILLWDDVSINRAIAEASAAFLAGSPQVTPAAGEPGIWWIGATGLEGVGGEQELVRALARIARDWHPHPRIAVADSCVAARAATWGGKARESGVGSRDSILPIPDSRFPIPVFYTILPSGTDPHYLASAPLDLVPMDAELRATLHALGLRTAGALAALEAEDVERRWGIEGLSAWQLARGEDRRRPVLARAQPRYSVDVELPAPASTMEPVLFLLRSAAERLSRDLVREGRAAAAISITLTLDNTRSALPSGGKPHTVTRETRFSRPTARAPHLFDHCRALLERFKLSAAACGVTLSVIATAPAAGEQGDALSSGWRDPAAVDAALARLRAALGPDVIVRPVSRDDHRPESAGKWEETTLSMRTQSEQCAPSTLCPHDQCCSALRLLESPEPIEVEKSSGIPCAMWWRGGRVDLVHVSGPERLSGDWWKDGYARDYWRCDTDSAEFLIFLDRSRREEGDKEGESEKRWFLHGWRD
ncbi:MAG: hypothetical protein ABR543_07570 [Gemmatimonadaceae bacterium]